jgi:hypothetical protein
VGRLFTPGPDLARAADSWARGTTSASRLTRSNRPRAWPGHVDPTAGTAAELRRGTRTVPESESGWGKGAGGLPAHPEEVGEVGRLQGELGGDSIDAGGGGRSRRTRGSGSGTHRSVGMPSGATGKLPGALEAGGEDWDSATEEIEWRRRDSGFGRSGEKKKGRGRRKEWGRERETAAAGGVLSPGGASAAAGITSQASTASVLPQSSLAAGGRRQGG